MANKDFDTVSSYLHDEVHLLSELAELDGKENVMHAGKAFAEIIQDINIRSKFANDNQVMLTYDITFPEPVGTCRAAGLLNFENGKIKRIELFYDTKIFDDHSS